MHKADDVRLRHMRDAAKEALEFAQDRTRSDLEADRMLVLALVKAIEIVGEAATQLSEETRATIPNLPWVDIIAMRHRLVHAYFDIDLDVLWQTVQHDLPGLLAEVSAVLRNDD